MGSFNINATVDSDTGTLNQPVLLSVTVSGEGNIEALPEPVWPEFTGWRVFESRLDFESHVVAGRLTGSRVYEISLAPEVTGELVVPEISYTHFDPVLEEYVQVATDPISVSVVGADGAPPVPEVPEVGGHEEDPAEMRALKPVPNSIRQGGSELTESYAFWAVWGLPFLAILGAVACDALRRPGNPPAPNTFVVGRSPPPKPGWSGPFPRELITGWLQPRQCFHTFPKD